MKLRVIYPYLTRAQLIITIILLCNVRFLITRFAGQYAGHNAMITHLSVSISAGPGATHRTKNSEPRDVFSTSPITPGSGLVFCNRYKCY